MTQYTIVTMFRDPGLIEAVMAELRGAGIVMNDQRILDGSGGNIELELMRRKVDDDHVRLYVRGVQKGYPLLVGTVDGENLRRASDILNNHGPVDISDDPDLAATDTGAGDRVTSGTGMAAAAAGLRNADVAATAGTGEGARTAGARDMEARREEVIPVFEEQIAVGKRAVERGGVRVRSYVVETPVEETVRLRDETVHVERRSVVPARPAGEDDFREKTIEVTEMDEEAVVAKQARVIEEVVVRKDVAEVEQTITNTVRRTKVAVENTGTDVASDRMAGTERTRKSSDKA